ncbi:hypothetical protein AWN76_011195 [Rhodothermaceae bacterium RA]|nr:hypothetical protein AWN76_011195 [Rhodothermaceae bacterium RA]
MIRLLVAALVLGTGVGTAGAQGLAPQAVPPAADPPVIHITDRLLRGPEAQAALAAFEPRTSRSAVRLQQAPTTTYRLGQTQTFKVRNLGASSTQFDQIEFTLKAQTPLLRLWVETAELEGRVRDEDVEALRRALGEQTPEGSVDPDAGIIANNHDTFGQPPNVDGDGVLDVLLLDIRDGRSAGEGYVAGFVDPLDLSSAGNNRDVLYLDTRPGLVDDDGNRRGTAGIEATAAHEYQHLIRLAYDRDETTFVDEGLSEWAELLNGYPGRSITYLGEAARYNVALFRWSSDGSEVLDDYQRAGLFTTYLAERIGRAATGGITQDPANGMTGYRNALVDAGAGVTIEEVLSDFHVANLVNDPLAHPYRYVTPQRTGVRAAGTAVADGRTGTTETPRTELDVQSGAVRYLTWTFVDDFTLTMDVPPSVDGDLATAAERRARLRVRAILEREGAVDVRDVTLGTAAQTFAGSFDRVTLAVTHIDPNSRTTRIAYEAAWTNASAFRVEPVAYDDGVADTYALVNGTGAGYATRFVVPEGALLGTVRLPMYYLNEFGDDPPDTAQRDFNLTLWDAAPDGTPGTILFSTLITDPRPTSDVFTNESQTRFLEVDLTDDLAGVTLPEVLYVGARNDGDDSNYIVYSASDYTVENASYLLDAFGTWTAAWDVTFTNGSSLENHVIPVRVEFLIPRTAVPVEAGPELPRVAVLHPNYPNPFNPRTTIRFDLPEAAVVRLAVYDLLGRPVATLLDGLTPAGSHTVTVDARRWASGVYLYVLDTGTQRLTRRMLLLK